MSIGTNQRCPPSSGKLKSIFPQLAAPLPNQAT